MWRGCDVRHDPTRSHRDPRSPDKEEVPGSNPGSPIDVGPVILRVLHCLAAVRRASCYSGKHLSADICQLGRPRVAAVHSRKFKGGAGMVGSVRRRGF
jgi:hypothetical protein